MEEYLVIYEKLTNNGRKLLVEYHATKELAYKILDNCKKESMYCQIYDAINMTEEFYRELV